MADVKIRNLPDWLVEFHKHRAEKKGVSLEEHLRQSLEEMYFENRRRLAKLLDEHVARIQARTGILPDSTPLIREARIEMETQFDAGGGRKRRPEVARPRRKSA